MSAFLDQCLHLIAAGPPVHHHLTEREDEEDDIDACSDPAVEGVLLILLLGIMQGEVLLLPFTQWNILKEGRASNPEEEPQKSQHYNAP